jgi:hypothetical protein
MNHNAFDDTLMIVLGAMHETLPNQGEDERKGQRPACLM